MSRRSKMKYIKQKHITGCGVAAVAMLTGVSYNTALKAVRPDRKSGDCACTSLTDFLRGIEDLGHKCHVSYKKSQLQNLDRNAMIVVRNPTEDAHTPLHVVIWDAEKKEILDPWGLQSTFTIDHKYIQKYEQYRIILV